jgi:hypothetical protein
VAAEARVLLADEVDRGANRSRGTDARALDRRSAVAAAAPESEAPRDLAGDGVGLPLGRGDPPEVVVAPCVGDDVAKLAEARAIRELRSRIENRLRVRELTRAPELLRDRARRDGCRVTVARPAAGADEVDREPLDRRVGDQGGEVPQATRSRSRNSNVSQPSRQ